MSTWHSYYFLNGVDPTKASVDNSYLTIWAHNALSGIEDMCPRGMDGVFLNNVQSVHVCNVSYGVVCPNGYRRMVYTFFGRLHTIQITTPMPSQ